MLFMGFISDANFLEYLIARFKVNGCAFKKDLEITSGHNLKNATLGRFIFCPTALCAKKVGN